ncbi:mitotic-spindle organizing gamma-tubulin ring associated-domain-containing protein [Truncatella angustata]|uniref:Mitotic-spindle organizing protein 1 n=1 Tax=Truncatella angustata TaxID=152316 RepID=A0A9P8RKL8_9PEZI|nr:mitotic-spindle organizing gamma-tubulin ring associated-domain-containing protein [Truncatella angustata]KAH6645781.1 mitotic-spindle organizing gamma-tubulin ring associated-domain-containing protein [Truncatella angustata]
MAFLTRLAERSDFSKVPKLDPLSSKMPPTREEGEKQQAAQQAVDILHEISTILNCQLDRRTLSICISMIENGVNPEALASSTSGRRPRRRSSGAEIVARKFNVRLKFNPFQPLCMVRSVVVYFCLLMR